VANVLINTVDQVRIRYLVMKHSNAHKDRSTQDIIGRPNTNDYINYKERDLLPNCTSTKEDIVCAEDILGPNLGLLKKHQNTIKGNTQHM